MVNLMPFYFPERDPTESRLPPCPSLSDAWDPPKLSGYLQAGFTTVSASLVQAGLSWVLKEPR